MNSDEIEINKLPFNDLEKKEINGCVIAVLERSAKAQGWLHMNFLNVFLAFIYIFSTQNPNLIPLILLLHGLIFFLILKSYYFHKYFTYAYLEDYLNILDNFFKKNKIKILERDILSTWTMHGAFLTAADRVYSSVDLDKAINNIAHHKEWKHLFKMNKLERFIGGVQNLK